METQTWHILLHGIKMYLHGLISAETVVQRCYVKKVFLKISQSSQKNTCARVSFLLSCGPEACKKMRLWRRCFPVNFATFLRTPFFTEHVGATASALTYEMFQNILNKTKYCTRIERENVILQKHSKYGLELLQKKLL